MNDRPSLPRPRFIPPTPVIITSLGFLGLLFVRGWRAGLLGLGIVAVVLISRLILWIKSSHSEWAQEKFRAERAVSASMFRSNVYRDYLSRKRRNRE
jgi:hypothetical protein